MAKHLRMSGVVFAFLFTAAIAQEKHMLPDLMPMPAKITPQAGQFRLDDSFKIAVTGNPDPRLYAGATRALRRLAGRTGLFLPQDFLHRKVAVDSARMTINCERAGRLQFGEEESYTLEVSSAQILLRAPTDLGALRGLETLLQLLAADRQGFYFPNLKISDAPRFPWRGLMIDAASSRPVALVP